MHRSLIKIVASTKDSSAAAAAVAVKKEAVAKRVL